MDRENAQERAEALEMVEAAERLAGLMLQQQKAYIETLQRERESAIALLKHAEDRARQMQHERDRLVRELKASEASDVAVFEQNGRLNEALQAAVQQGGILVRENAALRAGLEQERAFWRDEQWWFPVASAACGWIFWDGDLTPPWKRAEQGAGQEPTAIKRKEYGLEFPGNGPTAHRIEPGCCPKHGGER